MIKKSISHLIVIALAMHLYAVACARSVHRPEDPCMPTIKVNMVGDKNIYVLKNANLRQYPLFELFDKDFFQHHMLPTNALSFRNNPHKSVKGSHLMNLMEELLLEIKQKKKQYKHFTVLQNKGFNRRNACGLLIVKFKDYPFVLKLFLETPKSFINPWAKGFEPIFFFYMGGGVNRHLSGFTRIKNLAYIKQQIAADPTWATMLDTPHKWFWLPQQSSWLNIVGMHIGGKPQQQIRIPAVYGIIADAITPERTFSGMSQEDTQIALQISNKLESHLDLHITNFIVEKDTHKVVIIDTEHFPTMIGLTEKQSFDSYISWYLGLIKKCAKDMLFSTKKDRRMAQQFNNAYLVPSVLNVPGNQNVAPHTAQLC